MAKRQTGLENIFKRTEPGGAGGLAFEDLDAGNIQSTGVGLREGEIKALKQVGAALGEYLGANKVARNSIMRLAIRRFLEGLQDGSITLAELSELFTTPEKPQPKLKL